jgi:putative membrane protein
MAQRSAFARALGLVVTLPVTLLIVAFAVSNRGPVAVGLWPFEAQVEMPVYLLGLGGLLVGVLVGGGLAGLATLGARMRARREARRADAAERSLAEDAAQRAAQTAQTAQAARAAQATATALSTTRGGSY